MRPIRLTLRHLLWTATGDAETFAANYLCAHECTNADGRKFKEYQLLGAKERRSTNERSTRDKNYRRQCTSSVGESHRADRDARVPHENTAYCTLRMRRIRRCSDHRHHHHHHFDILSAAMRSPAIIKTVERSLLNDYDGRNLT